MSSNTSNFWQQHIEKVLLAVGGLILLVVAGYYLAGSPYAVRVAGQMRGEPAEVEEPIRREAERLRRRLNRDQPLPPEGWEQGRIPTYARRFEDRFNQRPSRLAQYDVPLNEPGLPEDLVPRIDDVTYALASPPLPVKQEAQAGHGMLGYMEDQDLRQQLIARLPSSEKPYDFRYVSVSGQFPMAQWLDQLDRAEGGQAVPENWRFPLITAVYLQRQRRNPETGKWESPKRVGPLPSQIAYLPDPEREWGPREASRTVRFIQENQQRIARPEFVPMAQGVWRPPGEAGELSPDEQRRLRDLNRRIQQLSARQQRLRDDSGTGGERLRQVSDRLREALRERSELTGRPMPDNMRGPRPVTPAGPGQRGAPRRDPAEIMEETPEEMMTRGSGRRRSPEGNRRRPPRDFRRSDRSDRRGAGQRPAEDQASDVMSGHLRVWAHDISAEPGHTYRYRLVATVMNPLFLKKGVAEEQRQKYFHQIALAPELDAAESTSWTDPVTVAPKHRFFLVGGSASNRLARVEVWRLYRGQWRRATFDEQPGDPVGGQMEIQTPTGRETIDMRPGAVLVDVTESSGEGWTGKITRMLYRPEPGASLRERILSQDREAPARIRLQNEADRRGRSARRP